ncbi:MAG: hypothetical protein EXR71_16665 [Myxococcales bacterium]|nr:hypothetical protein [Myxococcales bacterium]
MTLLLLACTGSADTADTGEQTAAAPTVSWVSPQEGEDVGSSTNASVTTTTFTFVDLAKHGDGGAAGFVRIAAGGTALGDFDAPTFTLAGLAVGDVLLSAQLYYDDGDEVLAKDGVLCAEDDDTCAAVSAEVNITVSVSG